MWDMAEPKPEDCKANFKHGNKWYLVRCPVCKRENYAIAVAAGQCAWCGYDANADKPKGTE